MKKIFLDTNIIIDYLADRKPFSDAAATLYSLAARNKISIYVSAISFNNTYYILKSQLSHAKAIKVLKELQGWTRTIEVNEMIIKKSLEADFNDFEDGIQYFCATSIPNITCIVTRNTKDYKAARIPILTPTETISLLALNQ